MTTIYAKTEAGQNEIETRTRRLPPRARSLLILIDGKRTDAELGAMVQAFDDTLRLLLDGELIQVISSSPAKSSTSVASVAAAASAPPAAVDAPPAVAANAATLRRDAVRAIVDLLGPAGDPLALRIERAQGQEDLQAALERAVTYIATARGGGAAALFANRFLKPASS